MVHKLLSVGNAKLPNTVAIFNLLAVIDCPNCETCKDTCYALWRQGVANVYGHRKVNSDLARTNIPELERRLAEELTLLYTKKKIKYVRIHESGDFINEEYFFMWTRIAVKFPRIKFFAMSKALFLKESYEKVKPGLKNFNLIFSLIDDTHRNYGTSEYCDKLVKNYGAYACPDIDHKGICMVKCFYCLNGKKPCFKIHGNLKGKDTYADQAS